MRKFLFLFIGLICSSLSAFAQPANDNCEDAIPITEVQAFCSVPGQFTNVNATLSGYEASTCFSGAHNDVWFSFVALATDVTIIIRGRTTQAPGGSLRNPEATLYEGSCGSVLQEFECETDNRGNQITEVYKGGLIPGQTYLIRVQGRNGETGTFQLCINNYNPPADPTSDCPDASILCDKSGFSVQKITGAGRNNRELDDAGCFSGGTGNNESNSTWYTWICEDSGDLTFTLTPLNETDDLDFVVYELPNGLGDCSRKRVLRCMASGDFAYPSRCMGPTGLRAGETDDSEPAGCNNNRQNSFLQPLQMERGRAYALAINNFTSTDNGLSIEFGGTGTFRGPEANFTLDASINVGETDNTICLNEQISFTDSSSFDAGRITAWTWTFGVGASTPINRLGEGPHDVTYTSAGEKIIALTVETDLGCTVTEIAKITVTEPPTIEYDFTKPDCGGGTNGDLIVTANGGSVPYFFDWGDSGEFILGDNQRNNLAEGTYTVVVKDAQNCTSEPFDLFLPEDSIQLNESVIPVIEPSCTGFSDGILVVSPVRGTAPYEYDFGNGFVSENTLENIPTGIYTVDVRDGNGCSSTFSIDVGEPDSLQIDVQATNISCKGLVDGVIQSNISGGVGGYAFSWNTGATTAAITELEAGFYTISIQDANGCEIIDTASIIEPDGIDIEIADIIDANCSGESSGIISLLAIGGTPAYEYSLDGETFQASSSLEGLAAGIYELVIRDSRGCLSDDIEAEVQEPDAFSVEAGEDQTISLGFDTDLAAIVLPLDKQVRYQWSGGDSLTLSCLDCFDPNAFPFNSTEYTITVIDENGCTATDAVIVRVNKDRPIYIPSAFAPESQEFGNNGFTLFGGRASVGIRTLKVFSRWGELLFEANDIPLNEVELGWNGMHNGQMMNTGVYAFYAEVEFLDREVVIYEGDVTLMR